MTHSISSAVRKRKWPLALLSFRRALRIASAPPFITWLLLVACFSHRAIGDRPWQTVSQAPDFVVPMTDDPIHSSNVFQYFVFKTPFRETKWVSSAEVMVDNRAIQDVTVFVRPPEAEDRDQVQQLCRTTMAPGIKPWPDGWGKRIPARSQLVFRVYCTGESALASDTRLGLWLVEREQLAAELKSVLLAPDPNRGRSSAAAKVNLERDEFPPGSRLWAIAPEFEREVTGFSALLHGNNTPKILVDLPNYTSHGLIQYVLEQPVSLDDHRLNCIVSYNEGGPDNFESDPRRSQRLVGPGLAGVFLEVAVPLMETTSPTQTDRARRDPKARKIANRFFEKLDINKDGKISPQETPLSYRVFAFRKADRNRDQILSMDEVLLEAHLSLRP